MPIGLGAVLQAHAGWWLTRRLLVGPVWLPIEGDLLCCLVWGGPLACLVSATLSAWVLFSFGPLTPVQLLGHWLTEYCANALGVLLIAPLVLLAWRGKAKLVPEVWLRIVLPLLMIAVLLGLGSVSRNRVEAAAVLDGVVAKMQGVHDRNIKILQVSRWELQSLERFFAASKEVSPEEFSWFTANLQDRPGLVALDWLPRVTWAERPAMEAALRQRGGSGIYELNAQGQRVPAGKPQTYFPVTMSASPSHSVNDLLGLDRSQSPLHQLLMEQARDSGKPAASTPFQLLRGGQMSSDNYLERRVAARPRGAFAVGF